MMVLSKGIDRVNLDTRPELSASAGAVWWQAGKNLRLWSWLLKKEKEKGNLGLPKIPLL
jgi:hypothetical protein